MVKINSYTSSLFDVKLLLLLIVGIYGCSDSRNYRKENIEYLTKTIGDVLLHSRSKTGGFPETINDALKITGTSLNHRGDVDGHGLSYRRISKDECYLHSSGPNNIDENGDGDDVVVYYSSKMWYEGNAKYLRDVHPKFILGK